MKVTQSVSFWILVFSFIIACLIGSFTHWIVGVILFFMIAGKAAIYGLVMDTISGSLTYHHDREDDRARRIIATKAYLKAAEAGKRPVPTSRLKKLII